MSTLIRMIETGGGGALKNTVSWALAVVMSMSACMAHANRILQCNMNHPSSVERSRVAIDAYGRVTGFAWTLDKKSRGFCNIQGETFLVINDELYEGAQGCQIMTWRQGGRLTLALSPATPSCRAYCSTQQAYESLLPLVFDGVGCSL